MNISDLIVETTTSVPFVPIYPAVNKCNYYIKNDTVHVFNFANPYGGIPQNLTFNIIGFLLLFALFILLRKSTNNYGRRKHHRFHIRESMDETPSATATEEQKAATSNGQQVFDDEDLNIIEEINSHRKSWAARFYAMSSNDDEYLLDPSTVQQSTGTTGLAAAVNDSDDQLITLDDQNVRDASPVNTAAQRSDREETLTTNQTTDRNVRRIPPFAWLKTVFTLTDEDFQRFCGSDAVIYLSFQRHLIAYCAFLTVICLCVILPVNFQGSLQGTEDDFGHTTISNLEGFDPLLWVHVVFTIFTFPVALFFLGSFIRKASSRCHVSISDTSKSFSNNTLVFINLPDGLSTSSSIKRALISSYGEHIEVENIDVASDVSILTELDRRWLKAHQARLACESERKMFSMSSQLNNEGSTPSNECIDTTDDKQLIRPMTWGILCSAGSCSPCSHECSSCICCARKVDAHTFYYDEELTLIQNIEDEKGKIARGERNVHLAFVSFAKSGDARKVYSDWFGLTWRGIISDLICGGCGGNTGTSRHRENSSVSYDTLGVSASSSPVSRSSSSKKNSFIAQCISSGVKIAYAPHTPSDIVWSRISVLTLSRLSFLLKMIFINLVTVIVLTFFTSPAYIISQLDVFLNFKTFTNSAKINDFLPTLLLWTLSALLPLVIGYMDYLVGHWRKSSENLWIMRKVYVYLLLMVLILPSIGLTTLRGLIELFVQSTKPLFPAENADDDVFPIPENDSKERISSVFQDFDDGGGGFRVRWSCIFLPDNGAFFVNYVITSSLVGTALELLRFYDLFVYSVKMCLARSRFEAPSVALESRTEFMYGFNYGWMLLIFALTSAYSVICPLITPFGLFYFIIKHLVDRYNLYYAYKPSGKSNTLQGRSNSRLSQNNRSHNSHSFLGSGSEYGNLHSTAVDCAFVALLLQQLTLLFFNIVRNDDESSYWLSSLSVRAIVSLLFFLLSTLIFVVHLCIMPLDKLLFISPSRTSVSSPSSGAIVREDSPTTTSFGTFDAAGSASTTTRGGALRSKMNMKFIPDVLTKDHRSVQHVLTNM